MTESDRKPLTIAEFLTARLDESESGWRGHKRREDDGDEQMLFHFGRRLADEMIADIAAKRAIIKEYLEVKDWDHYDEYGDQELGLRAALHFLAESFSDHPDYSEKLRP